MRCCGTSAFDFMAHFQALVINFFGCVLNMWFFFTMSRDRKICGKTLSDHNDRRMGFSLWKFATVKNVSVNFRIFSYFVEAIRKFCFSQICVLTQMLKSGCDKISYVGMGKVLKVMYRRPLVYFLSEVDVLIKHEWSCCSNQTRGDVILKASPRRHRLIYPVRHQNL